jgi:hypothetical protein
MPGWHQCALRHQRCRWLRSPIAHQPVESRKPPIAPQRGASRLAACAYDMHRALRMFRRHVTTVPRSFSSNRPNIQLLPCQRRRAAAYVNARLRTRVDARAMPALHLCLPSNGWATCACPPRRRTSVLWWYSSGCTYDGENSVTHTRNTNSAAYVLAQPSRLITILKEPSVSRAMKRV